MMKELLNNMKQIDYKKKYEEALKTAKILRDNSTDKVCNDKIEAIFPELVENEKIRKELIEYLINKSIAWLEKQGKVKHTCRNCQAFQDLHQNCPYSPIYQYKDLTEAHKHLDDETNCEFWLEKQEEQPNPYSGVSFEYDGHVWGMCARDNGVDILLDKQLFEHLDKVEPKFKNRQNPAWSEEYEQRIEDIIATLMGCVTRLSNYGNLVTGDIIASLKDDIVWLKSLKEKMKGE